MIIAIGMDVHDRKCAVFAAPAGKGRIRKTDREFIDSFNEAYRRVKTDRAELEGMVRRLDGYEYHILMENSTIAHKVFWMLKGLGAENVIVAQAADLYRITKSVKKNDDNDANELAGYMRRRLSGEREFSECVIAPPEIMAKKQFIRAVLADKDVLSDTKKRVRSRVKVMGRDLSRDYVDISCAAALRELRGTMDPYLLYEAEVMRQTRARIAEGERHIEQMFSDSRCFELIGSIPGIGTVTAAYLTTIIIDIGNFGTKKDLESYTGLVPKQHASASSDPDCRTTHRGDEKLRRMLQWSVMAHVRWAEDSVVTEMYNRLRARGKPHRKILTACARKLVDVVWGVLRRDRPFTTDRALLANARQTLAAIEAGEGDLS